MHNSAIITIFSLHPCRKLLGLTLEASLGGFTIKGAYTRFFMVECHRSISPYGGMSPGHPTEGAK